MKTHPANLDTTIALRLNLENVGCEELAGNYKAFRFYWIPRTGATRIHGQSNPAAHNATQMKLLSWVLSQV